MLLFAVQEAIQTSLGFSPFELVFSHTPRGPLKLLKEAWLDEDHSGSLLTCISDICLKLQTANRFAQENKKKAQCNMKTWYDKKARKQPGESHGIIADTWESTPSKILRTIYCTGETK